MPALIRTESSTGRSEDSPGHIDNNDLRFLEDHEYPALLFPGYSEKPLSEQLEPIAVIGMGCRFPGEIDSPPEFWEMMMSKGSGQTPKVPASRFNIDAYFHPNNDRPGSLNVLGGYFLSGGLQEFDPTLFGISPIEAMWMDPQQRKLLEVVYEAFESGGVPLNTISGSKVGCFVGSFTSDFQQMSMKEPHFRHSYAITGVDPGIISNRINYVFNLTGPSSTVNTACSSSLYALHEACNALRNKECSGAIVGGTNLVLTVDQHMNTAKIGVLSPTSTCHTFDESADGYGRADGIAACYLKLLRDAVSDGDPIRAVIRSSAVNSNGKAPAVGISHPSLEGQVAVIRHAYERGGHLDPLLTGYFECHGTGTPVGDPLEVEAVASAMNRKRKREDEPLWIGAVKPSIGHSEAASGLSAVIKAILAVERGIIPPTRGVVKLNPKGLAWDDWKVRVVNDPVPFPETLPVKRVSVNSFGYGGTNAHVIIEGADSLLPSGKTYIDRHKSNDRTRWDNLNPNRPFLLQFSAHDQDTLRKNIVAYSKIVDKYCLLDLSYTLANRRTNLPSRAFVVASHAILNSRFSNNAEAFAFAKKQKTPTIGFAFTGQGAQWAQMGLELMVYYPSFLKSIRILDSALKRLCDAPDWTLEEELLRAGETSRVHEAEFSQPLCTALQIAIVQLLELWGIRPVVTVGHSSGEISAAFTAGLISAEEAVIVAYYRGKVVRDVSTNGAMMAVGLGAESMEPFLAGVNDEVMIACHNSPTSVTLSGDANALEIVKSKLDAANIFAKYVKTGGKAYHSHHMKPVFAKYTELIRRAKDTLFFESPQPSDAVMISSVSNSEITSDTVADGQYWSANLCNPVLFNQAIQNVLKNDQLDKIDLLIEIGPHPALSGPIRQICEFVGPENLKYLPTLVRDEDSASQLLKLAGELFLKNYPLDTKQLTLVEEILPSGKIHRFEGSVIVDLPTYKWNYSVNWWMEPRQSREQRAINHGRHDLLGARVPGGSTTELNWRNVLRMRDIPWLKHHSLGDEAVFPAAGYFSIAIEAITQINERRPVEVSGYVLRNVSIKRALVTPNNDAGIEVICNMRPSIFNEVDAEHAWWDFNISSVSENGHGNEHVTGSIAINARQKGQIPKQCPKFPQRASGKAWNQALREVGFDYGPTFQDMTDIRFDGISYSAACKTVIKSTCGIMDNESRYVLHPSTVDSCLQNMIVAIYAGQLNGVACGAVPIQVEEVAIWVPTAEQLNGPGNIFSWADQRGSRSFVTGSQLTASDGEMLVDIVNMRCTSYEAAMAHKSDELIPSRLYGQMEWTYDIDSFKQSNDLSDPDLEQLVKSAVYKKPNLKIIEIGSKHAGALLSKWEWLDYTITEKSDKAVEESGTAPQGFKNARVQHLDISQSLNGQGAPEGSFDLVIASAEELSLAELKNIWCLLIQGGHAILATDRDLSADDLQSAGFSKVDLLIRRLDKMTLALCTAVQPTKCEAIDRLDHEVRLVYRKEPAGVLFEVKRAYEKLGWHTTVTSLKNYEGNMKEHVIMLADFEGALLATLEENELAKIQEITSTASMVLWVSCGGLMTGKIPEYAMNVGLIRSIASEQNSLDLMLLDFDLENTSTESIVDIITMITERQSSKVEFRESEYYVSKGIVYINRLVPHDDINREYAFDKKEVIPLPFDQSIPLAGKVQSGKIVFEADPAEKAKLKPGHIEVQVSVVGLNKEDILVINGSDCLNDFSHEIGGTVQRVGASVTDLNVGDHVFGFNFSKFNTTQCISADLIQKIEVEENLSELVSLPMAYGTALYGLKNLAKLEAQEKVLILAGTGASGLAAIKVSQLMKGIPYVAVSTESEATMVMETFNLDQRQIIMASQQSIITQFKASTGGQGPDVVFSSGSVNATIAQQCWRHIERFGRFIDSGRKNLVKKKVLDTVPLHRGASYLSFDILELYNWKPQVLGDLLRVMTSLYRQRLIVPLNTISFKLGGANDAVTSFSDNFTAAKPLILYEPSNTPLDVLRPRPRVKCQANATYLLVGCLGGLGRSLTSWMIKRGARRFAFLSRSGTDSEQAASLVKDIEAKGAVVQVFRGDVTILADVERAVASVPREYPICGVVQAAMVLRDGLFQSMRYDDWIASTQPKVQGTMNLLSALEHVPLDFFVMTSSVSGILGTPGQSNYAAANCFLDSLARHRVGRGQKATSLILSMVLGVGYVAEHIELEETIRRKGIYGIDEDDVSEAFEVATATSSQGSVLDHLVLGMDPSKLQKSLRQSSATDAFWIENPHFNTLCHRIKSARGPTTTSKTVGSSDTSILATIRAAATPEEAVEFLSGVLVEKLSRLLLVDSAAFELDGKSIADYGLDSMIGAEFRNWVFRELGLDLPFNRLLDPELSIGRFARMVVRGRESEGRELGGGGEGDGGDEEEDGGVTT